MKNNIDDNDFVLQLAQSIRNVCDRDVNDGLIPLHAPFFGKNEHAYVKDCLDSTYVSSVGKFVDQFENELAAYTGAKKAIAVVNGTSALHIALKLAGVKANDEVLIPTLTFVATANAVSYCGAIPHFVDAAYNTLGLDPYKLRVYLSDITEIHNQQCINKMTGRVIRSIVPMHTFGHPVDMDEVLSVAKDYYLNVVEDAAESLGSTYYGQHTGTMGLMGILSFNGNKIITTGGGGAILTNNIELARAAKHITTTAKIPHKWNFMHDEIGYNYRMPNLNAALGCAQLERLQDFIDAKKIIFTQYKEAFKNIEDLSLIEEPDGCSSNYWLQTIRLHPKIIELKDKILSFTNESGIMTRPVWTLMHKLPQFHSCPAMSLETSEILESQLINIPSSNYHSMLGKNNA